MVKVIINWKNHECKDVNIEDVHGGGGVDENLDLFTTSQFTTPQFTTSFSFIFHSFIDNFSYIALNHYNNFYACNNEEEI